MFYRMVHHLIHLLPVGKTQFHLCRMDINIQDSPINCKLQRCKRIFMLHHKCLIAVLNCLGDNTAFDITPIDKIILIISVSPGDDRFSDKSINRNILILHMDFYQIGRNIPSVNTIDNVLQVRIPRRMQLRLIVIYKFKCNLRMGQRHTLHQIADVPRLGHRALQKFLSRRSVIKNIPYQKRRPLRRANLIHPFFRTALNEIPASHQVPCRFRNQLYLTHSGNTGERFPPEAQ